MNKLTIAKLVQNGASANEAIDPMSLGYTTRLIVERALLRGWGVAHFSAARSTLFFQIPGRRNLIKTFGSSPHRTSYPDSKISKNKAITSCLLACAEIPVPTEMSLSRKEVENSTDIIRDFLNKQSPVVVKPLDASHGYGITTNLTKIEDTMKAIYGALEFSKLKRILIQKQYTGYDARLICINYKYVDAITRIPARVFGDGKGNIEKLIQKENNSELRGENYKNKLNMIDIEKARQYLGAEGIKRVPAAGEEVQVVGVSNVGVGGERLNICSQIPVWMKQMAETAAKTLELPVCGVDFLIKKLPTTDVAMIDLQPIILEVNECPTLSMYDDLHSPEQLSIIDTYLDYLESIPVK